MKLAYIPDRVCINRNRLLVKIANIDYDFRLIGKIIFDHLVANLCSVMYLIFIVYVSIFIEECNRLLPPSINRQRRLLSFPIICKP